VAEHRVGDEKRYADARERSGARRFYTSETSIDRTHSSLGWTWGPGGTLDLNAQLRAYRSTLDMRQRCATTAWRRCGRST
jgi:outer membrane receptor for ferrienterochelin and colicins